jgi:hypothetical protein
MPAVLRTRFFPLAAAVLAVVGSSGAADAGWVTIKNDTHRVIVVQWAVEVNGQVKRCRPVRLLPGERVREFRPSSTQMVEVFDTQKPIRLLHTSSLTVTPASQVFSVSTDGRVVSISPVPPR